MAVTLLCCTARLLYSPCLSHPHSSVQSGAGTLSQEACTDVGGLLFFMMIYMAFATLFAAIFTFPLEFSLLVKVGGGGCAQH